MSNLWDYLALMESTELKVVKAYTDQREEQHLAEEIRLKSHTNLIPDKGVLSTPQFFFASPFHKGKFQGRVYLGIHDCAFCKKKGHRKAQCPKVLKDPHSRRMIGTCRRQEGLYVVDELKVSDTAASCSTSTTNLSSSLHLIS
ncbi:unnamed protein product [Vicia faba]|uniref:CCHC-type domain-containing protein n=1 Tax=Vicia faba TaxID=3906 RepID=A0AAV1BAF9_VICFA|nr:unnamed protein product [Vicia faba]